MSSLQGADKLRARLNAIGKTEALMRTISLRGVSEAGHLAHHRTGNMRRTIRVGRYSALRAEIRAGGSRQVGYAAAEELGRKPVTIRPRPGRVGRNGRPAALAWGGSRTLGGRLRVSGGITASPTTFRRVVHQPARPAHPFLRPGLQRAVELEGVKGIVAVWNAAG